MSRASFSLLVKALKVKAVNKINLEASSTPGGKEFLCHHESLSKFVCIIKSATRGKRITAKDDLAKEKSSFLRKTLETWKETRHDSNRGCASEGSWNV